MRRIGIMLGVVLNLAIAFTANASNNDSAEHTPKSKRTALMLTLGSTIAPIVLGKSLSNSTSEKNSDLGIFLIGGGAILGPGAGQAYADRPVRFAAGAIFRTLCLGLAAISLARPWESTHDWSDGYKDGSNVGFMIGMGGYTLSVVLDIATVGKSVDAYNRKHAEPEFSVRNFYQPRDRTHGVALTLRF